MKPRCRFGCRFLLITPNLYLCPHAAWGEASWKLGAVEEARRLLAKAGGYDKLMDAIMAEEAEKKEDRRRKQNERAERVRYTG